MNRRAQLLAKAGNPSLMNASVQTPFVNMRLVIIDSGHLGFSTPGSKACVIKLRMCLGTDLRFTLKRFGNLSEQVVGPDDLFYEVLPVLAVYVPSVPGGESEHSFMAIPSLGSFILRLLFAGVPVSIGWFALLHYVHQFL